MGVGGAWQGGGYTYVLGKQSPPPPLLQHEQPWLRPALRGAATSIAAISLVISLVIFVSSGADDSPGAGPSTRAGRSPGPTAAPAAEATRREQLCIIAAVARKGASGGTRARQQRGR